MALSTCNTSQANECCNLDFIEAKGIWVRARPWPRFVRAMITPAAAAVAEVNKAIRADHLAPARSLQPTQTSLRPMRTHAACSSLAGLSLPFWEVRESFREVRPIAPAGR
jgi:hypothetical protein